MLTTLKFFPRTGKRNIGDYNECFLFTPRHTLTIFKVEFVEIHSGDQISQGLWFERGQVRVAQFPEAVQMLLLSTPLSMLFTSLIHLRVGVKFSVTDRLDQDFC